MTVYWKNKIAIVTGGSSGLGGAIGQRLAGAGAKIVLAARGVEQLEATADQLRQGGADVLPIPCDVTEQADVDRLIAKTLERFGRIDGLFNCAGRSARGEVLSTTPAEFDELLQLNFHAVVRCARAAAPSLLESKGHLVNIGSLASKITSKYLGAYPVSKFAVAAYSQQLRLELGPQGLHVLLVCPGPIARADGGHRYDSQASDLPAEARRPGAGVKLNAIRPEHLAQQILKACERRKPELVMPSHARWLFAISQLWPSIGDWIVRKKT